MIRKMLSSSILALGLAALLLGSFGALAGVGHQNWSGQQTASAIGSPVVGSFPSESFGGALANEANADPNTVMYCRTDDAGGTSIPNCGQSAIQHQGVGPAAVSNLFNVAANSVIDFSGDFYTCFVATVVGGSGVQRLVTMTTDGAAGYSLGIDASELPVLLTYAAGPATTTTTGAAAAVIGSMNLICGGRSGSTQWLKLNNGAVQTTVNAKVVQAVGQAGYLLNDSATAPWLGRVYEASFVGAAPTEAILDALWTSVATCRTAGRCLPTNASEVAYFNGDSYIVGGSWTGTGLTATLTGQLLTAKSRYNWGALRITNIVLQSSVLANASWTKDANVTVADVSASCPVDPQGVTMSLVTIFSGGTGVKQDVAATPARSVYLAKQTGNPDCTVDWSDYSGDGSATVSLVGTPARFTNYTAGQTGIKVIANTCPSWCQSSAQLEATTSVGQFCGQTTTASVTCSGGGLAWTHNGTVPRATQSNLYPEGFGAKHGGIASWSVANDLSLGNGVDVLDMPATGWSACYLINPGVTTGAVRTIFADKDGDTTGWNVTLDATDLATLGTADGATDTVATATGLVASTDNVICGGVGSDGKGVIALNGGTPVVSGAALGYTVNANKPGRIGRNNADLLPCTNCTIKEAWFSSTPITSGLATAQMVAALSCTKPGRCFAPDANTVMHCYVPEGGGKWLCPINTGANQWTENGTLTKTTPARYSWPAGVDKRDVEGAGPFSNSNYFTSAVSSPLHFGANTPRSVCASFYGNSGRIFSGSDGAGHISGWEFRPTTTGTCNISFFAVGTSVTTTDTTVSATGENICCGGYDGANGMVKLNGGTLVSSAFAVPEAPASAFNMGNNYTVVAPFLGTIHELWISATPASDALFTKIQRRWLDHQGSFAQPVSITRTTEATTVVDGKLYRHSAGTLRLTPSGKLYEGSVVNPAQYSEQWDNAVWADTHGGATDPGSTVVTADQTTGMDGTTTADKLVVPAGIADADDYSARCQDFTATAAVWSGWAWVKTLTGTAAPHLYFWDGAAAYHSTTCAVTTTYSQCKITSTGNLSVATWKLCIGHDRRDAAQITTATETFYAWGAQIELGSFAHQYCGPTLNASRTCNADAVTIANPLRPPGNDWTNSVLQSEDISTTWTNSNTAETVNITTAPDGSFTADLLYENDATDAPHYLTTAYTATAVPWTCSGWVKAMTGGRSVVLTSTDGGTTGRYYDLTTCAVGSAVGAGTTGAVTSGPDGWCRVATTQTMGAGATSARIYLATADGTSSYAGEAGKGVYVWGWQCEPASTASPYCPTTTVAATCGSGGATGKVTTNSSTYSSTLANVAWTKAATVTVADADATCPLDATGQRMSLVTSGTVGNGVSQDVAATTARSVYLALPTGGSSCSVSLRDASGDGPVTVWPTTTPARSVAYAAGQTGLSVVRYSTPTGSTGASNAPYYTVRYGNYAYTNAYASYAIDIFDVSTPTAPVKVNMLTWGGGTVSTEPFGLVVRGTYLYISHYFGAAVWVYSLTNPALPALVGTVNLPFKAYLMDVSDDGNYAYVAGSESGNLYVLNTSNKAAPSHVGTVALGGTAFAVAALNSTYVFASVLAVGIKVIDVSNPAAPVVVGSTFGSGTIYSIKDSGNYLYAINDADDKLTVYDVTDPLAVVTKGFVVVGNIPSDLSLYGTTVLTVGTEGTLSVVDISNPDAPSITATIPVTFPQGAAIDADYIYVGYRDGVNSTFNIFSRAAPTGCASWCQSSAQLEVATFVGPFCGQTFAAAKTCGPSQKWCVRVKDVTPENGKAWAGGDAGLFLGGASIVAANSLYSRMSGNNLEFGITDAAAVGKLYSIDKSALVSGTFYTFKFCSNDGTMTMYQDDVLLAPSLTGAGIGLLSAWPSTLSLAASASGQEWNGYIGSIDFNTSGNPLDFSTAP